MRWWNGLTEKEELKRKIAILTKWHTWFAWFPVIIETINGRRRKAWLEKVFRRGCCIGPDYLGEYGWNWSYAPYDFSKTTVMSGTITLSGE